MAIPYHRRLLLLPHCLRSSSVCDAEYDAFGLLCNSCGACSLCDLRGDAERLGYQVMIAEGSPTVMKMILDGKADALLGVACLDVLEAGSLEKILVAGIPCMAIPLASRRLPRHHGRRRLGPPDGSNALSAALVETRTYVHLMRSSARLFEAAELQRLIPRTRACDTAAAGRGGNRPTR